MLVRVPTAYEPLVRITWTLPLTEVSWAPTVIVTVPGVVVLGRKSAPAVPFELVVMLVNNPTGVPSAVAAWKVTTVPSVTVPWLRSRVAVTWILVLVVAGAIGVSTAAVMTVGRARTNWVETSR